MYIPEHMQPLDALFERRIVDIKNIYAGIKFRSGQIKYQALCRSPIYRYAKVIAADGIASVHEKTLYNRYQQSYLGTSTKKVEAIVQSIRLNGFNPEYAPLAFRSLKRVFPLHRYDVADGHHRAAVLAALGQTKIELVIYKVKHKNSLRRLAESIQYSFK